MWVYDQSTGHLYAPSGELIATGYAGRGVHKNRPEDDGLANEGPLPQGRYRIVGPPRATTTHGPKVLTLVPEPETDMKGRAGFLIHGDSATRPGTASNGCVILDRETRLKMWGSGDRVFTVVPTVREVPA